MMFIVRSAEKAPEMPGVAVKLSRDTPVIVKDGAGKTDFFCVGEEAVIAALRDSGLQVVELRDGYYEDGTGGGVAIWGQGKYWEIRDTHFTVTEAWARPLRPNPPPKASRSTSAAPSSGLKNTTRSSSRRRPGSTCPQRVGRTVGPGRRRDDNLGIRKILRA